MSFVKKQLRQLVCQIIWFFRDYDARCYYCFGDEKRLHFGKGVETASTLFNVSSGHIFIGDNTIFGHNCMILAGTHEFVHGRRKNLVMGEPDIPSNGFDVRIGNGCWIASGAIVIGGVTIGDNVIVGAGSVVTRDVPSGVFVAGVPARVVKSLDG